MPTARLIEGECIEMMRSMESNSIDAVVTDPPYELGFMGKSWDRSGIAYRAELWQEVARILKPGGHVLAFGGTRTYHRMACAIEDAGMEIRDQLQWLYGSGFPKSLNVSKAIDKVLGAEREIIGTRKYRKSGQAGYMSDDENQSGGEYKAENSITLPATPEAEQWDGWGTALKPANEPICLARKPLSEKTVAANVLRWGTGGINVDGCRIGRDEKLGRMNSKPSLFIHKNTTPYVDNSRGLGRFPANILLDESAAAILDEQSGESRSRSGGDLGNRQIWGSVTGQQKRDGFDDSGGASRFFYVAKASGKERGAGNNHPTVKPIRLMRYLCRLITPPGGTVLDPFAGSGTTLIAAQQEGFNAIGIEMMPEYCEIIRSRLEAASSAD